LLLSRIVRTRQGHNWLIPLRAPKLQSWPRRKKRATRAAS
jgi:hypothetical protein